MKPYNHILGPWKELNEKKKIIKVHVLQKAIERYTEEKEPTFDNMFGRYGTDTVELSCLFWRGLLHLN